MQRTLFFTTLLALMLSVGAIAQEPAGEKKSTLAQTPTTAEEASKALGVLYSGMFRNMVDNAPGGEHFNVETVLAVMKEILLDKKDPVFEQEQANSILTSYFKERQEEINQQTRTQSEQFLEENAKKEGIVTTKSGLQYLMIKEGTGIRPTVEDTVLVHYRGMLIDGTEFDSSIARGEPVKFNPLQVIPGWTEGLCLLQKGAKARFFIPADLAYGERGVGNIPPYSALIFDVELLDVIKGEPIPLAKSETTSPSEEQATSEDK